ncbi:Mariner Mos1 transposase [Orchesella cincta]|uniref:Mariner Mos1 transposase n=1 Tax=Orchesella cincta TaxID=48709 RepID=A0A1D2M8B3_ORCCI|nr:Mariner Mos1 transposase [Orchesella cincta]
MDTATANERDGIAEMRRLIEEFLTSKNGSLKVREYIASVAQDDTLLQIYLKGRKYEGIFIKAAPNLITLISKTTSLISQDVRAQVKLHLSRGLSTQLIRNELKNDGVDPLPDRSTITRWCQRFRNGDPSLENRQSPGRPLSATDEKHVAKVKAVVEKDRRLLLREIAEKVDSQSANTCSNEAQSASQPRKSKPTFHGQRFFLGQIVTGDETYLHHYEVESKRQSSQWLQAGTPPPLKAIRKTSKAKIMMLVFWDRVGVLLTAFFYKGATMTGQAYADILVKLKKAYIKKRGQDKWDDGVFLLHDNAPSHTSRVAKQKLQDVGFIELHHPPHSPDLAPSDFHLFPKLKNYTRGRKYNSDEHVKKSATAWLANKSPSFFSAGILALEERWNNLYENPSYRADYAWETLKRYAEVRFDEYPELFPDDTHDTASQIKTLGVMAMLKSRDEFGRRIVYVNGEKWNPDEISFDLMTTFGIYFTERELFDDDVMTNGIIFIHNCSGMGFKHARMFTLRNMLKWLNIYWRARPLKVGGVYFINVPSFAVYLVKLIKPFFSQKLKERFIVSTRDKKFETLHEKLSPNLLPKCLGGTQEDDEAFDWEFLQSKK